MTDALQHLHDTVDHWRSNRTVAAREALPENPYGPKLHDLNTKWGEVLAEHDKLIADKREAYLEERRKLTERSAQWREAHPAPKRKPGRPTTPHPDEVKIAAAKALQEGVSKSTVRAVLAVVDTKKLDQILQDGEALLNNEKEES
jgi:hypothetical protein